jgi:hypothetical protein
MDQLLIHPFLGIWGMGIESGHLAIDWKGHTASNELAMCISRVCFT